MRLFRHRLAGKRSIRPSTGGALRALLTVLFLASLCSPVHAVAQSELSAEPAGATEIPLVTESSDAEQAADPTVPVQGEDQAPLPVETQPILLPTDVPVLIPSPSPTEIPVVPTEIPSPTPTEVPPPPVNTDTVTLLEGVSSYTLEPGGAQSISLLYAVTTPRASTTLYAELLGAGEGWTLASPALVDADAGPARAAWTESMTLLPGTSFVVPITVTAPASVTETHAVSLLVWSTAAVPAGVEDGVVNAGVPLADFTVVAPPPILNTDWLQVAGESSLSIPSGGSAEISLAYTVTTPRVSTTLHVELLDEAGNPAPGWTLSPGSTVTDTSALEPGMTFSTSVTVLAPAFVEVSHVVSLVVWSDATIPDGSEAGVTRQVVASVAVAATPAEPTLECESGGEGQFTCRTDPDRPDVIEGSLLISGPPGWTFRANDAPVPESGLIDLAAVMESATLSEPISILATYEARCADFSQSHMATIRAHYHYQNVDAVVVEAIVPVQPPPQEPVTPSVSMQALDFGVLRWDGSSWGSSEADSTVVVSREGCGDLGAFDVYLEVVEAAPGLEPVLISARTSGTGIVPGTSASSLSNGPVPIAHATSDFTGVGEIVLGFYLEPGLDAQVGTHQIEIRVTTTRAP